MRSICCVLPVAFILLLTSCADGDFNNDRDQLKSVYGLYEAIDEDAAGIVGRILDESGSPINKVKVFAHGDKQFVISNHQGGFYLPFSGSVDTVYLMTDSNLGLSFKLHDQDNKLLILGDLTLKPLTALVGKVESGAAPLSGAKVSLEGTPYHTESDIGGRFALGVPPGDYTIVCEHLLYEAIRGLQINLTEGDDLLIKMEPLEFPSARIESQNTKNGVLRGKQLKLAIRASSGVRYMRIIESYGQPIKGFENWNLVQPLVTLEQVDFGYSQIRMQFMDQFSRVTDPIDFAFFSTQYDESYRVFWGDYREPVTIGEGEKAIFMGQNYYGSDQPTVPVDNCTLLTCDSVALPDAPMMVQTRFLSGLKVLPGATIIGAADFYGDTEMLGTQDKPITWKMVEDPLGRGVVSFFGETHLNHQSISHGILNNHNASKLSIGFSEFDGVEISYRFDQGQLTRFERNSWTDSRLSFVHPNSSVGNGSSGGESEAPPNPTPSPANEPQGGLTLISNTFQNTIINGYAYETQSNWKIRIKQNNFFLPLETEFFIEAAPYFASEPEGLNLQSEDNYFESKARIIADYSIWQAILGPIAEKPHSL
ncbi:MAG: hypothetical protein HRU19_01470 [Pseudobacteriovorax sp.]|nr:hypothetical protein [Pseudobacteriovorax sp.]